jgi:hypothetical protein
MASQQKTLGELTTEMVPNQLKEKVQEVIATYGFSDKQVCTQRKGDWVTEANGNVLVVNENHTTVWVPTPEFEEMVHSSSWIGGIVKESWVKLERVAWVFLKD